MKKFTFMFVLFFGVVISSFLSINYAQENENNKDQLFYIHKEVAKPDMIQQYEETSKDFTNLMKESKLDVPGIYASETNDFAFYYLVPIENYGSIDHMYKSFNNMMMNADKDKMKKIMKDNNDAIDYTEDYIFRRSTDLSYNPDSTLGNPGDNKFIHWSFFYFKSGVMQQVRDLAAKIKDLYTKKGVKTGYQLWFQELGGKNGLMVVTDFAKSAADYYKAMEEENKLIGKDADHLWDELLSLLVKTESKNGRFRHDLDYTKN